MPDTETPASENRLEFRDGTRTVMTLRGGRTLTVTHGTTDGGKRYLVEFEAGGGKQAMLLPEDAMHALAGTHAAMAGVTL